MSTPFEPVFIKEEPVVDDVDEQCNPFEQSRCSSSPEGNDQVDIKPEIKLELSDPPGTSMNDSLICSEEYPLTEDDDEELDSERDRSSDDDYHPGQDENVRRPAEVIARPTVADETGEVPTRVGNKYLCVICNRIFVKLNNHRKFVHKLDPLPGLPVAKKDCVCPFCPAEFFRFNSLTTHCRLIHDLFHCRRGCKKFFPINIKESHDTEIHGLPERTTWHPCPLCSKSYKDKGYIKSHCAKKHLQYYCIPCNIIIPLKERVPHDTAHHKTIRQSSGKRFMNGHLCDLCTHTCDDWNSMLKHYTIVHEQFYCNDGCQKLYPIGDKPEHRNLFHVAQPNDDGKYPCTLCPKIFVHQHRLSSHRKHAHKVFYCFMGCRELVAYKDKVNHIKTLHE